MVVTSNNARDTYMAMYDVAQSRNAQRGPLDRIRGNKAVSSLVQSTELEKCVEANSPVQYRVNIAA